MNKEILISLVVGTVIIGIVAYKLHESKTKSNFCLCSGLGGKYCSDPNELKRFYAEGKITEFTIPQHGTGGHISMPYDAFQKSQNQK